MRDFGGVGIH